MKKIGIFGGTFNPIHNGHLKVGREVRQGFDLDKILLVPAAVPPHKKTENVAKARDRLEMIRLAIEKDPCFEVSDLELKRRGPSYTIDTVERFESIFPENTRLYFIVGMDAFLDIESWKSYGELFRAIPFIVMSRPGLASGDGDKQRKSPRELLISRVSSGYVFDEKRNAFFHPEKKPVFLFDVAPVDISATMIRKRIKRGRKIDGLVPEKVKEFIEKKGLYL
jgi:nicotinate-nucleotide adenylyltransferase